jgi:3-hydroxyisobutyrate dehydrogenase
MDIGFIGLGAMGKPMARNLAKAGNRVVGWNRSPVEAPEGVTLVESPRKVAEQTEATFVMVSAADAVEQVLFGTDGWTSGAKPGSVIIQSSTVGPTALKRIAGQLESAGFLIIDAPVGGSVKPAQDAQLVVIGGGDQELFDRYQSLFDAIAARTVRFGGVGVGSAVKLAVNGLLVSVVAAAAESTSWLLEQEPGLDLDAFGSVVERVSPVVTARMKTIAGPAAKGGFSLRQAAKDMELVGSEFGSTDVMEAARGLARTGLDLGYADLDFACLGSTVRSKRTA